MKKTLSLIILVFALSGCMQSTEHLTLGEKLDGTFEANTFIPKGTLILVDNMFGSMSNAFNKALDRDGQPIAMPKSMSEEIFSQKEIQDKADRAGLNISILDYKRNSDDEGLHVYYKITFDNINKFTNSEISSTNVRFNKDKDNNWVCQTVSKKQKADKSITQVEQFNDFRKSDQFKLMDSVSQDLIVKAMSNFQFEFIVTTPKPVQNVTGAFEQVDDYTARVYVGGNFLENPDILKQLAGERDKPSTAAWSDEDLSPQDEETKDTEVKQQQPVIAKPNNLKKIFFNDGTVKEAEIIEETDDYIKILYAGMDLTYYLDDINHIE